MCKMAKVREQQRTNFKSLANGSVQTRDFLLFLAESQCSGEVSSWVFRLSDIMQIISHSILTPLQGTLASPPGTISSSQKVSLRQRHVSPSQQPNSLSAAFLSMPPTNFQLTLSVIVLSFFLSVGNHAI